MEKPPAKKETAAQVRAKLEAKGLLKPKQAPMLDSDRTCLWCKKPLPSNLARFCDGICYDAAFREGMITE